MTRLRALAALVCATAVLGACEKNAVQDITGPLPAARVKFFNFGLNAPSVNFYANNTKMTAVNSTSGTESTSGVAYGSVGAGGFYSAIEPGQYTLSGKIAAATDKDLAISSVSQAIAGGKAYSFYQSGLYNATTKTVDAFVVEDDLPAQDFTVSYVRFVNAIYNAQPMTLYIKNTATNQEVAIGGPVAYKSASAFVAVPGASYDLSTRVAGSNTNVIVRTGVSFEARKVYTISARGDITVGGTTATNRPFLDNTANR